MIFIFSEIEKKENVFFQVVVVSENFFVAKTKNSETLNKKKFKGQKRQIMTLPAASNNF